MWSLESVVEALEDQAKAIDTQWILLNAMFVMFMQVGFCLLEAGSARVQNTTSVILKNSGDFLFVSIMYYIFGYALAYGESTHGFAGTNNFFIEDKNWAYWFFQCAFANTAATIVSGCLLERTTIGGYIGFASLIGCLVYPIVSHWIWSSSGWLSAANLSIRNSLYPGAIDFAGAGPVHIVGGLSGLVGTIYVGPRIGFIDPETGKVNKYDGHSVVLRGLGCFILWFGFFSFNSGSTIVVSQGTYSLAAVIACNTAISGAAAGICASLFLYLLQRKHDADALMNGSLTGLVAITAGCASFNVYTSLIVGAVSGIIYVYSNELLLRLKIDDPVSAVPVHLAGGTWGVLAPGLFAHRGTHGGLFTGFPKQLGIQLLEILVIYLWVGVLAFLIFSVVNRIFPLRVSAEEEEEGLDEEVGQSAYPEIHQAIQALNEYVGLEKLLETPNNRIVWVLHAYLQREFSSEGLDFLLAVREYSSLARKFEKMNRLGLDMFEGKKKSDWAEEIMNRFRSICSLYILGGAQMKLSLPDHQRAKLLELYENADLVPSANVFDAVEDEVMTVLKNGAFKRFWKDYQKAKKHHKRQKRRRRWESRSNGNLDRTQKSSSDKDQDGKEGHTSDGTSSGYMFQGDPDFWRLAFDDSTRDTGSQSGPAGNKVSGEGDNSKSSRMRNISANILGIPSVSQTSEVDSSRNHSQESERSQREGSITKSESSSRNFRVHSSGMVIWKAEEDFRRKKAASKMKALELQSAPRRNSARSKSYDGTSAQEHSLSRGRKK